MNFAPSKQQISNNELVTKGNDTLISAGAGCSKSTSLRFFAQQNPNKNFLVLCFNKANAVEALEHPDRPKNIFYATGHSLAFGKVVVGSMKNSFNNSGLNYTDISETQLQDSLFFPPCVSLSEERFAITLLRKRIKNAVELYCRSASKNIEQFAFDYFSEWLISETILVNDPVLGPIMEKSIALTEEQRTELAKFTKQYWLNCMDANRPEVFGHDQYLKMFHLKGFSISEFYDKQTKQKVPIDVLCLDECLTNKHYVKTSEGPWRIKRLVDAYKAGEYVPEILSFNRNTSTLEYKKMEGALVSENREVYTVISEGLNKIHCTSNHMILTQRGYVPAAELMVGKDIMYLDSSKNQKAKKLLNKQQYQVMLGSYLGDGHLNKRSEYETYRLKFTQGIKQIDYLQWKANSFGVGEELKAIKSGYTGEYTIFQTRISPTFLLEKPLKECLKDLGALGLAIWYMDDGSYSASKQISLHSNSFSLEENEYLLEILRNNFNINGQIKINKEFYYITFSVEESKKIFEIISPYAHLDLKYKFPEDVFNTSTLHLPELDSDFLELGANYIKDVVYEGVDTVYDITVADNHNFVTACTFDGVGTIVHNCQDSNPVILSIFNSFSGQKIVVGDSAQQLYSWRGAINAMHFFRDENYTEGFLTESFRFNQTIANEANKILRIMGENYSLTGVGQQKEIRSKAILARTNGKILTTLLNLVEENPNATFTLAMDLQDIARKLYHINSVFWGEQPKYPDQSLQHIKTKQDLMEAMAISDEIASLSMLCQRLAQKAGTLHNGLTLLKQSVAPKGGSNTNITLSTIHKSKGLEWDEVTILDDLIVLEKNEDGEADEESLEAAKEKFYKDFDLQCLAYVACTRAKVKVNLPWYLPEILENFNENWRNKDENF